jgi:uncharacterized protein (DUF2141 family)
MRALLLVGALLASPCARAATVAVTVHGVRNAHGHVRVALCKKAEFLHPNCAWRGHAAAAVGDVVVRITNVPPGTYAAQAFHDENDDGKLDRNILGLPREAMGFSNDAPMRMGPPKFDAAAFDVKAPLTETSFKLRYF